MDISLKNKFDSIIFDLDGTLWDSTANVAIAWQKAEQEVDFLDKKFTVDTIRGITGMTYKAIFETLFPDLDENRRNEFKAIAAKYEIETLNEKGGELYPQLEFVLQYLQTQYKLFIVSNCQNNYIETFLNFSKLGHYFLAHQCYGTKNAPKAENIIDIVNDHHLQAPVYVGDTMGDFTSSQKAGVPFIFAAYGFGKVEEGQVATIEHFSDLLKLL